MVGPRTRDASNGDQRCAPAEEPALACSCLLSHLPMQMRCANLWRLRSEQQAREAGHVERRQSLVVCERAVSAPQAVVVAVCNDGIRHCADVPEQTNWEELPTCCAQRRNAAPGCTSKRACVDAVECPLAVSAHSRAYLQSQCANVNGERHLSQDVAGPAWFGQVQLPPAPELHLNA